MNLVIRPMEPEDIPVLADMEADIFSQPWSEQAFQELFSHSYDVYLVAEADGALAGCAGMALLGEEGDIGKVMVAERFRGRGIGFALVDRLLQEGVKRGADAFTLEVRKSNEAAVRLYEKAGFFTEGVRPRFYEKPVEDALIMWRRPTITKPENDGL